MRNAILGLFTLILLAAPTTVRAQTLTVEVDATVDLAPGPSTEAPSAPPPRARIEDDLDGRPTPPRPIVVVPPLEPGEVGLRDVDPRLTDPPPAQAAPSSPPTVIVAVPAAPAPAAAPAPPPPQVEDEEDIEGWGAFGIWVEGMDLSGLDLELHDP
jgi:hypothetical protein